ncbi:Sporulation related domain protein [Poriferisphaera corsica]|uniref:Sporulation related domain protein n=1 Tax=Poriferisphaera corsica TaxID=2528020 RepID=A0A517YYP0_9BACT|nr:SPOR domain-containing protein [Poriferisphaera corsica]QDU35327.1 Sporulation related domain protein [Poriferisphaera corsica]
MHTFHRLSFFRHTKPILLCALLAIVLQGCIAMPESNRGAPLTVQKMNNAYNANNHQQAYQHALILMNDPDPDYRALAYYTAAKSNLQLGNRSQAIAFLTQATQTAKDPSLIADAYAELGIQSAKLDEHAKAAGYYIHAAKNYPVGNDRANAYYYAAISQQKIGQLDQAKKSLFLARSSNADHKLLQQIDSRIFVAGYTIQIGAYTAKSNAISAAQNVALRSMTMNLDKPKIAEIKNDSDQVIYRVQIGNFTSFKSANYAKHRLGIKDAIVIPLSKK